MQWTLYLLYIQINCHQTVVNRTAAKMQMNIWFFFAKGRYYFPLETSLAINLVVSTYNSGMIIKISKLQYRLTLLSIQKWKINGKLKVRKEYTKLLTSAKKDPN